MTIEDVKVIEEMDDVFKNVLEENIRLSSELTKGLHMMAQIRYALLFTMILMTIITLRIMGFI